MIAAVVAAGATAQLRTPQQKVTSRNALKQTSSILFSQPERLEKTYSVLSQPKNAELFGKDNANARGPRRSVANGVYYYKPEGTMFGVYSEDGYGYYPGWLRFPSMYDIYFVDQTPDHTNTQWLLSGGTEDIDLSQYPGYVSENNDTLTWSTAPAVEGYSPTVAKLQNGRFTYQLGEAGRNFATYPTRMSGTSEITPMGFFDDHNAAANYYGWSSFNQMHYLFGAGYTIEDDGSQLNFYGLSQSHEKPVTPLYVESIGMPFFTFEKDANTALPGKLSLVIFNDETGEETVRMEATAADVNYYINEAGEIEVYVDDEQYGSLYAGSVHFSLKGDDGFGGETEESFVIDYPFTIYVIGFEGANIGTGGVQNQSPDECEAGHILYVNKDNPEDEGAFGYSSSLGVKFIFNAIFDNVLVEGNVETNSGEFYPAYYVQISDNGADYENAIFSDLDGALVECATPWFDEEGNEYYYADWDADWILAMEATPYGDEPGQGEIQSAWNVGFTAEPLPEGIEGRGRLIFIEGRGVTSEQFIFVFQGDAEAGWDDAMENYELLGLKGVKTNNAVKTDRVYNLMGQQVSGSAKGLLVKNGKKYLSK